MFKNRQGLGAFRPQRHLTFNIGGLKFCDLAKLRFFIFYIMTHRFKYRFYGLSKSCYNLFFLRASE